MSLQKVGWTHLLVLTLQDTAGAPEEAEEHQLCLLQPRVRGNDLQNVSPHLLSIIWSVAEDELQKQAVILIHLQPRWQITIPRQLRRGEHGCRSSGISCHQRLRVC